MKSFKIFSFLLVLAVCMAFSVKEVRADKCIVDDGGDFNTTTGRYHQSSLRWIVESVINPAGSQGGCTITSSTADGSFAGNYIVFLTDEVDMADGSKDHVTISTIRLKDVSPTNPNQADPIKIKTKKILMIGNPSSYAIEIDPENVAPYVPDRYRHSSGVIRDAGRITLDARDLPVGQSPFKCESGASDTYLRGMIILTNGLTEAEMFQNESCLKNGGDIYVCEGDRIEVNGQFVDPRDVSSHSQWCNVSCTDAEKITLYRDEDKDNFGLQNETITICPGDEIPDGYTTNDRDFDCEDDPTKNGFQIKPTANEICDGIDNDCDGLIDAQDPNAMGVSVFYEDADGDLFGNPEAPVSSCNEDPEDGQVADSSDCDDSNAGISPIDKEICGDGIDQNCDGVDLECDDTDTDGDGTPDTDDCAPNDATIHPGATEICGDDIDQNCSGTADEGCDIDNDDDGYNENEDCDDNNPAINPGAIDVCFDNVDQNCDGEIDENCVPERCDNLVDDDRDGLNNCDDPDCESWYECNGVGPEEECGDDIDNDDDGFTDCDDKDCALDAACLDISEDLCDDEIDNDGDGTVDCDDSDCSDFVVDKETGQTCADLQVNPNPNPISGELVGGGGCGCDLSADNQIRMSQMGPVLMGLSLFLMAIFLRLTRKERKI